MQGGLFDLTPTQSTFLYCAHILPAIVTFISLTHFNDLLTTSLIIQLFYVGTSLLYIRYVSKQQQMAPYLMGQLRSLKLQCQKGLSLSISAFMLLTIYSIIILKLGRVVLPTHLELGSASQDYWPAFLLLGLLNPILEQWYWRLFIPKTIKQTFIKTLIVNISYLVFHFSLFSHFLGFWRSIPLVGTFNSVGRSMTHIKNKFGIISAIITHYGITLAGLVIYIYVKTELEHNTRHI